MAYVHNTVLCSTLGYFHLLSTVQEIVVAHLLKIFFIFNRTQNFIVYQATGQYLKAAESSPQAHIPFL